MSALGSIRGGFAPQGLHHRAQRDDQGPRERGVRAGERLPELASLVAVGEARYAWVGKKNIGEGRMTMLDRRPDELVRIKLEFFKPFAATNTAEFRFKPADGGTAVTWSMSGHNNLVSRMVGGQFEQGLSNMKNVVERHG